jgi:hypothetical protein
VFLQLQDVRGAVETARIFLVMAEQKSNRLKSPELVALRVALAEEGLSQAELARGCGIPPASLSSWIWGGGATARPRHLIERFFGYRRPIWSTSRELDQRKHCLEVFGADPYLLTVKELRQLARETGADFSNEPDREGMIREILAKAAVTRNRKSEANL